MQEPDRVPACFNAVDNSGDKNFALAFGIMLPARVGVGNVRSPAVTKRTIYPASGRKTSVARRTPSGRA